MENSILFRKAEKYLVGGVNSPVRSFSYVGGEPILIKKGRGSKVYDYDGREYIDYVLSYGAMILGHAYPKVVKSLKEAIVAGSSFGTTTSSEIELARLIQRAIPLFEKIRFVNSGTEAAVSSIRLARGYTGRDKVIKFKNAYHGHVDYFLTNSKGVPNDFIAHTIISDYGDKDLIEDIFKRCGQEIAAVIVEPVGGNYGVTIPDIDFLKHLRKITEKYGTLLIFDEVITGFRFTFGSCADLLGIKPDLICLGKIIGGGLPIGAYGGKGKIMNNLAPLGEVYQASTFGGNPVVMRSGIATLNVIASMKKKYKLLKQMTEKLSYAIEKEARRYNIDLKVTYYGTMFSVKFKEKTEFQCFYRRILERGVYFAPSEHEANFLSFAHKKKDIDKTIHAVKEVFKYIARRKYESGNNRL